jgi:hypothetical protein
VNIWVEYFRYENNGKNTWAQIRELPKWNPPDPEMIHKRFCQNREDADRFAKSMNEQGYHATIKTDKGQ